jgi:hypothetical protein
MAKLKISDEEFARQYEAGVRRGAEKRQDATQAKSASYERASNRLIVELKNGVTFMIPCDLIQGLRDARPEEIAEVEVMPRGMALHWERLDQDFSVAGLMAGVFGNQAWMSELGRQGGSITSEAKAVAARENGRKGGRPRAKRSA